MTACVLSDLRKGMTLTLLGLLVLCVPIDRVWGFRAHFTSVTASVDSVGSLERASYDVVDSYRNRTVSGQGTTQTDVSNLIVSEGIVAWREQSGSGQRAGYAVYDGERGSWRRSEGFFKSAIEELRVRDGVIVWIQKPAMSLSEVCYATYNPWTGTWSRQCTTASSSVTNLWTEDGIVTWSESSGGIQERVGVAAFDPETRAWVDARSLFGTLTVGPDIVAGSVVYTLNGVSKTNGWIDGSWEDSATLPQAGFRVNPDEGAPTLAVWLTDMSVAGSSLDWDFGDGSPPSSEPSVIHEYTEAGLFMITQTVFGVGGGQDQALATVKTDVQPPIGTIVINNDDPYTAASTVDLTLSAVDDSGLPVTMRFSNNQINWTAWEGFTSDREWTLAPGEGLRTAYVQYRDTSLNVSVPYSDTIIVDSMPPISGSCTATASSNTVLISWSGFSDPTSGVCRYRLTVNTNAPPANAFDGELLYSGQNLSFLHQPTNSFQTFYYRLEAEDCAGNVGPGLQHEATPFGDDDSDGDGLPDWWEERYSGSSTGMQPSADLDEDYVDNWGEFVSGTVPTNAMSVLAFQAPIQLQAGSLVVVWPSVAGRFYRVTQALPTISGDLVYGESSAFRGAEPPWNAWTLDGSQPVQFFRIEVYPETGSYIAGEFAASGNGSSTIYGGTVTRTNIVPGTWSFGVGSVDLWDDGEGGLNGAGGTGTLTYETGAWLISFTEAPQNGSQIESSFGFQN